MRTCGFGPLCHARPTYACHGSTGTSAHHGGEPMGEAPVATLWKQFKELHCQDARSQIIRRYAHLVSITAGRLFGPLPSGVERDDLVGAGVVGLVKAVDQFDPTRGIKFETYAITLIRGAILEMLRGDDWVPRLVRDQQKQLKQAYIRLEARPGGPGRGGGGGGRGRRG